MVDNVTINAMSGGDTIAADDIAGIKYQRVKVGYGADGTFTDVDAGAPLPALMLSGIGVGSDRVAHTSLSGPTQLPDHPQMCGVTVRAILANVDVIYVGGADVTAANGFELAPGEAISLDVANSNAIYIDAPNQGDGVCLVWVSV
jgi:hypothetical protein